MLTTFSVCALSSHPLATASGSRVRRRRPQERRPVW